MSSSHPQAARASCHQAELLDTFVKIDKAPARTKMERTSVLEAESFAACRCVACGTVSSRDEPMKVRSLGARNIGPEWLRRPSGLWLRPLTNPGLRRRESWLVEGWLLAGETEEATRQADREAADIHN